MITLSDNPSNTTLMYVYVRRFKWFNGVDNEQLEGHPIEKKLYRAAYNNDTKSYRIYYKSNVNNKDTCIVIPSLASVPDGYDSDIVQVTLENILELDMPEACLNDFIKWAESKNEDLKRVAGLEKKQEPPSFLPVVISEPIQNMFSDMTREEEIEEFIMCASKTHDMFPALFDAIHDLIHYINQTNEGDSLDSMTISLSQTHGAGYNVGKALDSLSTYMSDDRRVNLHHEDLLKAIYNLLNEQSRLKAHGD